jgi:hypothetical protein
MMTMDDDIRIAIGKHGAMVYRGHWDVPPEHQTWIEPRSCPMIAKLNAWSKAQRKKPFRFMADRAKP